jgi:cytochrome c-type biogenesis protein CcmE
MNSKMKKRLIAVTLVIVVVAAVALAFAGASGGSKVVSVADAASGEYNNQRVEVTGTVVDDSFSITQDALYFTIYDPQVGTIVQLEVIFEGAAPNTFGNGIEAICTGKIDGTGVLHATELVTKCPSKYESAEGSVTADYIETRGDQLIGVDIKLAGYVKPGTLVAAGSEERFTLYSQGAEVPVAYDGAMSDEIGDDSAVIVSGALDASGIFVATDVALDADVTK